MSMEGGGFFPLFHKADQLRCLIVGGGRVGMRKARDLAAAGARVTVVDPLPLEFLPGIINLQREFQPEDLDNANLVVAATSDAALNLNIAVAARARGVLVNVASAPSAGNVIFPAALHEGPITVAVSTGGASPTLAAKLRDRIRGVISPNDAALAVSLREERERKRASSERPHAETLVVIGLSHETAPVELRERLHIRDIHLEETLHRLRDRCKASEAVIVCTCNRAEFYARLARPEDLIHALAEMAHVSAEELTPHLFIHAEHQCALHLFRVAAGLESLSLGETQILGQVSNALASAITFRTAGRHCRALFEQAIAAGRRVRHETELNTGAYSIGRVAVELARRHFTDLSERPVLLLGAGKMSELSARHLAAEGAFPILVANRTFTRAQDLAKRLSGEAIHFDHMLARLAEVDIILCSTSAPHFVIHPDQMSEVMSMRNGRPIVIVDIAVPRDVDPAVANIPNVRLYNVDSLREVAEEHAMRRRGEIPRAERILTEEMERWAMREAGWTLAPWIQRFTQTYSTTLEEEIRRFVPDRTPDEVAAFCRSLTKKLLHDPVTRLKAAALRKGMLETDALLAALADLPLKRRKPHGTTDFAAGNSREPAGPRTDPDDGGPD